MKPFAVLLASHGHYAREALMSAEMIIGSQQNVGILSIDLEKSVVTAREELDEIINGLDTENGLLILTDIVGGTPSNLAVEKILSGRFVHAVAGVNLPVLLQLFSTGREDLKSIEPMLRQAYQSSYVYLNERTREEDSDESL